MTSLTNHAQFALVHSKALAALAKIKTPAIDTAFPKADEFIDVRDFLKEWAGVVDALVLEVAKIAQANSSCHGIDVSLADKPLLTALDGFLFYDLEQEAIGVRAAYQACHGPSAYDVGRQSREAA
jgi:hypothetical protein